MFMLAKLAFLMLMVSGLMAEEHAHVDFLTQDQARSAIVDDSIEPYFSRLQAREMAAKTGSVVPGATLAQQRQACRQLYRDLAREFTVPEQDAIRALVAMVEPVLEPYPVFNAEPWTFIKVDRHLEGGLPHTRGRCIVLSDRVLPMFSLKGQQVTTMMAELLVHEQTHVIQRLNPAPFAILFTTQWGFVRMPHEPIATKGMLARQLINPDGVDSVWAWPLATDAGVRLIQPQLQIDGAARVPRMPQDFMEVAREVHLEGKEYVYKQGVDGEPVTERLASIPAFAAAFAPADEIFHPNEIAAVLFSRMVVRDLMKNPSPEPPSIALVRRWAMAELAHATAAPSAAKAQ